MSEVTAVMRKIHDVTVEEYDPNEVEIENDPVWIPSLYLRMSDQAILEEEGVWLNDRLVTAAMIMLRKQFAEVAGLSDTVLASALRFHYPERMFVQVLHNGRDHWLTATNKNCKAGVVRVYDSKHELPNAHVRKQIAAMAQTRQSVLVLQSMNVDRQKLKGSCGLLAVAYAASLCMGQDPVNIVYTHAVLRRHLKDCVIAGSLQPFPVDKFRTVRKCISFEVKEKVYCTCRQIYAKDADMIECRHCKGWYHPKCIALSDSAFAIACANREDSFCCPNCVK